MIARTRRPSKGARPCIALALGCCACGSSSSSMVTPRVYTGAVDGTDARVAVIATDHHARVYFCGGDSSFSTSTHWFPVDLGGSGHIAASVDGGLSFDGQVASGDVRGAFVAGDGKPHPFVATAVAMGTIGGLYEADGPCGKIGLIVTQPSPAVSPIGQGACVGQPGADGTTPVEQVTPLRPLTRTPEGTIRVTLAGSTGPIVTHPATPPAE